MNSAMKQGVLPLMQIGKWLSAILIIVLIARQFGGNRISPAAFSSVSSAVTSAADLTGMQEADNQMIKRLYGLNPDSYDGIMLYYPSSSMGCEEILVVKLADINQQDAVSAAIESRWNTQRSNFDGYGTYQYGMLGDSVTDVKGNYILYVVAADTDSVRRAFEEAL